MSRRLIMFFISIFSLYFIVSISRSIYTLWQRGSVVGEREAVRDQLVKEHTELEEKQKQVESPEFIEKEAREKLNLQRDGEVVVVLPKRITQSISTEAVPIESASNWQRWLQVFY